MPAIPELVRQRATDEVMFALVFEPCRFHQNFGRGHNIDWPRQFLIRTTLALPLVFPFRRPAPGIGAESNLAGLATPLAWILPMETSSVSDPARQPRNQVRPSSRHFTIEEDG